MLLDGVDTRQPPHQADRDPESQEPTPLLRIPFHFRGWRSPGCCMRNFQVPIHPAVLNNQKPHLCGHQERYTLDGYRVDQLPVVYLEVSTAVIREGRRERKSPRFALYYQIGGAVVESLESGQPRMSPHPSVGNFPQPARGPVRTARYKSSAR